MASEFIVTHNFKTLEKFFLRLPTEINIKINRFWDDVTRYMLSETHRRFIAEVSPRGRSWKKHSKVTKSGIGILRKSEILMQSNEAVVVNPMLWKMENKTPYAPTHQFGASMKITRTQAWWMTFNLLGFDPSKPWEFMSDKEGKRRALAAAVSLTKSRTKREARKSNTVDVLLRSGSAWASYHGWKRAVTIVNRLTGRKLEIPKREFLGFSKENIKVIVDMFGSWFSKTVKEA